MSENIETPATETTETTETPELSEELVSINGRHFHKNTLNEEQLAAFDQAVEIGNKIEAKNIEARDLTYARQYLINFIEEGIDGYTEFFPVEPGEENKAESTEVA